jgi:hypothetical protein
MDVDYPFSMDTFTSSIFTFFGSLNLLMNLPLNLPRNVMVDISKHLYLLHLDIFRQPDPWGGREPPLPKGAATQIGKTPIFYFFF